MINEEHIKNTPVYNEPFQHFYVDGGVFTDEFYKTLINNLPNISHYNPMMHPEAIIDNNYSARDYFILTKEKSIELSEKVHSIWGELFNILDGNEFKNLLHGKVKDDIEKRHKKSYKDILCVKEIQIIRDSLGYKILPHPDGGPKFVSCLIYLPEDNSHKHLGTNIYKESSDGKYIGSRGKKNSGKSNHEDKTFDIVRKCEFKPNSMACFAVSKKSWHGVDEMKEKYTRNCIQLFYKKHKVKKETISK